MYGVVCVKIAKTFGYIQQLGRITLSVKCDYRKTHEVDPLRTRVFLDELHQSSVWHPLRNDLQRVCGNADERDDVRVP